MIRVRGTVQGVGFRPFVRRAAERLGLKGWVLNDTDGVLVRATGDASAVERFVTALRQEAPPAASVESVSEVDNTGHRPSGDSFEILASGEQGGLVTTSVPPDLALCPDCRAELLDPEDRRHGYAFINCTQCGPRYSIIESLPYDRPATTMKVFRMCAECDAEYHDASNRLYHAQPNACPVCGPVLALTDPLGSQVARPEDAIGVAADALLAGRIVAVKGVGGFHLMCDATSPEAVDKLRHRKHREEKPLAVMFPSIEAIRRLAQVSEHERSLLESPAAPIVLVRKIADAGIAENISPGNPWIGAVLPYSPVHALLLGRCRKPLVATSGNISEEPLCTDDDDARRRLNGIADLFLGNNRPVARPVDDSVIRISGNDHGVVLRRARGYAPSPFPLPSELGVPHLCVGAQMKNTVAVAAGRSVVLSPHIGDLANPATLAAFERTIKTLRQLCGARIEAVVHDKHPGYGSTRYALAAGIRCVPVQHHLAHLLSCLLENAHPADDVLGVTWDGTGYGDDGTVWGGEFILLSKGTATRFARIRPFRLPGGEAAVRDARRVLFSMAADESHEGPSQGIEERLGLAPLERSNLRTMIRTGLNSPLCSSAGRLFDAWAALVGVGTRNSFEGQLPMSLEAVAMEGMADASELRFPLIALSNEGARFELDWRPALAETAARRQGIAGKAASLHRGLAAGILAAAREAGVGTVALTGGCFQNALLHDLARRGLEEAGFKVLVHHRLSPNDGSIAAGQALGALLNLTDVNPPTS
jgi:hydrogenase maturation protein HypF